VAAEEAARSPVWTRAGAVPGGGERDADGVWAAATTDADTDVHRDCHGHDQSDVGANEYADPGAADTHADGNTYANTNTNV